MQVDVTMLVLANIIFAVRLAPMIIIAVTIIRGLILFSGQKREFEDWTRNPFMTFISILFFIPSAIFMSLRYVVTRIFGIRIESIGGSTTYGEITLFLKIEKPPRVAIVIASLYTTIVASVFLALTFLALPAVVELDFLFSLLCWYVAIGVLFNTSLRSGDISLIGAALKKRPRSGMVELVVTMALLIVLYVQLMGVPL